MSKLVHLGFPAPLLGLEAVRLPVVYDEGALMALLKPVGVLVQADSWYPKLPVMVEAIRYQAAQGKPEFQNLSIPEAGLWAVNDIDPELSGPVLFARSKDPAEELKNKLGSGAFSFEFDFLSKRSLPSEPSTCELPLARHNQLPRMLVSQTSGKKSRTTFCGLGEVGSHCLMRAQTAFPRRHQVLLHALECGFPVLGDRLYARSAEPMLSEIKRDYRIRKNREERPLFDGPACFLSAIILPDGSRINALPPARWPGLLKQLEKHTRP